MQQQYYLVHNTTNHFRSKIGAITLQDKIWPELFVANLWIFHSAEGSYSLEKSYLLVYMNKELRFQPFDLAMVQ